MKTKHYSDTDGTSLLELRRSGLTVTPPSVHESGEPIEWSNDVAATLISDSELERRTDMLAAAVLLTRHWPSRGSRQDAALYLSGMLLGRGYFRREVEGLLEAVTTHAEDDEPQRRLQAVANTAARLRAGERVAAAGSLAKVVGDDVVRRLKQWLPRRDHADVPESMDSGATRLPGDLTDTGNAELFARQHGELVHFVPTLGWLVYDESLGRFERDSGREMQLAMQTARSRFEQAAAAGDQNAAQILAKWGDRSLSRKLLSDALRLAETIPQLRAPVDAFDAHPMLLNVRNGVLDLADVQLLLHAPNHMMTKVAGSDYDPHARCELWQAHLERILAGDEAMIAFFQRLCGYALKGLSGEQKFAILYGSGANGKTVTVETLRAVLGEYAATADFKTFSVTNSSGPRNDLAKLVGTRLVSTAETSSGQRLDEAVIKQVTGGDAISVRFMYGEFFTYVPQYTVFLSSNHLPSIEGIDRGLWRRIFLIPFTVSIPEPEQDEGMQAKLLAELPGILAWMAEGCQAWQQVGFDPPLSVQLATAEYHDATDLIGQFIGEHLVADAEAWVELKNVYAHYKAWCEANGYPRVTSQQLANRLRDHGLTLTKDAPKTHRSRVRGHKLANHSGGEAGLLAF